MFRKDSIRWEFHLIQLLSVVGLLIAFYLWLYHEEIIPGNCLSGGYFDCSQVSGPTSPYSTLGNMPIAILGLAGYGGIFLVLWAQPFVELLNRRGVLDWLILGFTTLGLGFTFYLKGLELFVIHAMCEYCLYSAIIMLVMFGLAVSALWQNRKTATLSN